jgi:hypothetical protein
VEALSTHLNSLLIDGSLLFDSVHGALKSLQRADPITTKGWQPWNADPAMVFVFTSSIALSDQMSIDLSSLLRYDTHLYTVRLALPSAVTASIASAAPEVTDWLTRLERNTGGRRFQTNSTRELLGSMEWLADRALQPSFICLFRGQQTLHSQLTEFQVRQHCLLVPFLQWPIPEEPVESAAAAPVVSGCVPTLHFSSPQKYVLLQVVCFSIS